MFLKKKPQTRQLLKWVNKPFKHLGG